MKKSILVALTLVSVALSVPGLAAEKLGSTFDEIVAGAKREGKVSVYSPFPSAPSQRALNDAFNKRWGLDTQIEWVPLSPTVANTRAITESTGGAPSVDVIGYGGVEEMRTLVDAKLLKPYPWTRVFGSTLPQMQQLEGLVVPEYRGLGLPQLDIFYVVSWNPQFIKDEEVPGRLADFADPRWQGKFGVNAFALEPLSFLATAIGEKEAIDLGRRILNNKPNILRGSPAVNQAIVSGQIMFGTDVTISAQRAVNAKQPLKFKMFSDYIPRNPVFLYSPETAPHPNTARLFIAWMTSEGYKIAKTYEVYSSPIDQDDVFRKLADQQVAKGARIVKTNSAADVEMLRRVRSAMNQILTGN